MRASQRRDDRGLVRRAEDVAQSDPAAFAFDSSGRATLAAAGATWSAGRFIIPSIAELRAEVSAGNAEARLWAFDGAGPVTDIGALQATMGGRPMFQVASQFNCLEATHATVVPVADYFHDSYARPTGGDFGFSGNASAALFRPGTLEFRAGRICQAARAVTRCPAYD